VGDAGAEYHAAPTACTCPNANQTNARPFVTVNLQLASNGTTFQNSAGSCVQRKAIITRGRLRRQHSCNTATFGEIRAIAYKYKP